MPDPHSVPGGFSRRNVFYMREFYLTYRDLPKVQPLVAQIGWTHNLIVLQRCSEPLEREFYIRMTKKFGWTKNVLIHQIENQSYEKTLLGQTNFDKALMLMRGFVPDDGAQHKTVVEMTSAILGDQYRTLTDQFEAMRRKQNEMTYEEGTLLFKSEAQRAFSDAITLMKKILAETKSQNPQLELKFELKEK